MSAGQKTEPKREPWEWPYGKLCPRKVYVPHTLVPCNLDAGHEGACKAYDDYVHLTRLS
jgi:hypothetical protein